MSTSPYHKPLRRDLRHVAGLIPSGSRVLDLGCGPGKLMQHLMVHKNCTGTGVEIDPTSVVKAVRRGVPLIELDIDEQLDQFGDNSYDVVVLSRVLQATRFPATVLREMGRIGRSCLVSVPNFGYWRHRWVLMRGRMPMSKELPYAWFDTPNIHLSTLADLEDLFELFGLGIERRDLFAPDGRLDPRARRAPNLLAANAVYLLSPR